jgi:hypothetical protein
MSRHKVKVKTIHVCAISMLFACHCRLTAIFSNEILEGIMTYNQQVVLARIHFSLDVENTVNILIFVPAEN